MSFSSLPTDLLNTILSFLTDVDVLSLGGTCRKFSLFVRGNEKYWEARCTKLAFPKGVRQRWFQAFLRQRHLICTHCYEAKSKGLRHAILDVKLCDTCKKLPIFRTITKTKAIRQYKVQEVDLKELASALLPRYHYRCAAPMQLFLESDVKDY